MINILEKEVEAYFVKEIKKMGGWAIKLCPTWVNGLPDRLVVYKGQAFFVELKRPTGGIISELQKYVARKLFRFGFQVQYIFTKEAVDKFTKNIKYEI